MMNTQQETRFQKVSMESFYLLNMAKNAEENLVFDISGSTANLYQATIYPKTKKIFCNCPDARSGAKVNGCVCKHACFILSKVLKIPKQDLITDFFDQKLIFSEKLRAMILKNYADLEKISIKNQAFVNEAFMCKFLEIKNATTTTATSTATTTTTTTTTAVPPLVVNPYAVKKDMGEELECMICYDIMEKDNSIECPLCHNLVHKGCMEKWLANGKKNCIYCRSDVWKDYNKTCTPAKPSKAKSALSTEYKNLLD